MNTKELQLLGVGGEEVFERSSRRSWPSAGSVFPAIGQLLLKADAVLDEFEGVNGHPDPRWEEPHDAFAKVELFRRDLLIENAPSAADHLREVCQFVRQGRDLVRTPAFSPEADVIAFESRLYTILRWQLVYYLRRMYHEIPDKQRTALEHLKQIEKDRRELFGKGARQEASAGIF